MNFIKYFTLHIMLDGQRWHTPLTLALRKQKQVDCHEFQNRQGYIEKLSLEK